MKSERHLDHEYFIKERAVLYFPCIGQQHKSNMVTGENVEKRRLDSVENRDVMLEILNNWKGQGHTSLTRYDM